MTISHSEEAATGRIDRDPFELPERSCEGCGYNFVPVTDEPLCHDCVRELFESRPEDTTTPHFAEQEAPTLEQH
jgi:hypothetical protein